jgi:hypothetical protein
MAMKECYDHDSDATARARARVQTDGCTAASHSATASICTTVPTTQSHLHNRPRLHNLIWT